MRIWATAPVTHKRYLKKIEKALSLMATERELTEKYLNLALVFDKEIERLNGLFLGCKGATDVLAFEGDDDLLGEIAVSVDTAARQARERGADLAMELTLLAVHGMLHLVGYDDQSLPAWRKMKTAEFEIMMKVLR